MPVKTFDRRVLELHSPGWGDDGQKGIQMIKSKAGGRTIAQDEESSAVFGIPKRAIETDCIDTVLSADEVVPGLSLLNPE